MAMDTFFYVLALDIVWRRRLGFIIVSNIIVSHSRFYQLRIHMSEVNT